MIIGMDVSHGSPRRLGAPSIAAVSYALITVYSFPQRCSVLMIAWCHAQNRSSDLYHGHLYLVTKHQYEHNPRM